MRLLILWLTVAASLVAQAPKESRPPALPDGVRWIPDVPYDSKSEAQRLDVYLPNTPAGPNARPGFVAVHGGGWRGGDKRRGQWSDLPAAYAAAGYGAVSVNYRLTDEAPFPAQIEDAKAAVRWLRTHADEYGLDPNRIGAYGNSAGAHLVAMLGLVGPEDGLEGNGPHLDQFSRVNAVCASATPTDFLNWGRAGATPDRLKAEFFGGGDWRTSADRASPIAYVREDAPPFLLIHGSADKTVPISQSEVFARALREAGARDVRYMMFDAEGHGVFQSQQLLTYPAMKAFFDDALR